MVNGLQQLKGGLDLGLRLIGFHRGADNGDVLPLGRHVVGIRDHAHVDVCTKDQIVSIRAILQSTFHTSIVAHSASQYKKQEP